MPSAPAFSAAWAISIASRWPKPTPAITGMRSSIAWAVNSITREYSAGVSEYISPVAPAATTHETGCSSSFVRLLCSPGRSSDRLSLKGVMGNAITPVSLFRNVFGCMPVIYHKSIAALNEAAT